MHNKDVKYGDEIEILPSFRICKFLWDAVTIQTYRLVRFGKLWRLSQFTDFGEFEVMLFQMQGSISKGLSKLIK